MVPQPPADHPGLVDGDKGERFRSSYERAVAASAGSGRSFLLMWSTGTGQWWQRVARRAIVRTVAGDERDMLRTQAYGEPSKLAARQALWGYAERTFETGRITWASPLAGDETILDVGCGNGRDLLALRADGHRGRLIGVDFSVGMVGTVAADVAERVVGDALALPLPDGSVDVACAMHMLYHVPDIPAALREARRVLTDDGTFLASTNSEHTMAELVEPWSAAMVAAGGPPLRRLAFSLENGEQLLGEVFGSVEVKPMEVTARVSDAGIVRDYVASTDDVYQPMLPDESAWDQVLDAVADHAGREIDRHGTFGIVQRAGIFVCRPLTDSRG